MSHYVSFTDVLDDILDRAGESNAAASGQDYKDTATRQLVRAYYDLGNDHPYLFLRADPPQVIRTVAPITAGTVAVTQDADAITFSLPPAVSVQGRKLLIGTDWYRITAHTAGQAAATLDAAYAGATDAAAPYTVFQDEYSLAADTRHIVEMVVSETGQPIEGRDEAFLRQAYPTPSGTWPPQYFARIGERKVRFSQYPTRAGRIEVAYTRIPPDPSGDTDGSTLVIPANWRPVWADEALAWLYLVTDDTRFTAARELADRGRARLREDDARKRLPLRPSRAAVAGPYDWRR